MTVPLFFVCRRLDAISGGIGENSQFDVGTLCSRLELAKLVLGRLALLTIVASSCVNHNAATHTLQEAIQLEVVVQEAAQADEKKLEGICA